MRPLFVLLCQTTICLATADAAEPGRAAEPVAPPPVIWYDGIRSPAPAGKLLSDNEGFWGDCTLTGVEYAYARPPDNPADVWRDQAAKPGRRLLDGRPVGNWWMSLRPMQYLSYKSRLVELASSGKHHDVRVDPESLHRLIAWVDSCCVYLGEPEVRALGDPDFPGIERLPIRPRVATAPVIERP